jgi:hypothetical protein
MFECFQQLLVLLISVLTGILSHFNIFRLLLFLLCIIIEYYYIIFMSIINYYQTNIICMLKDNHLYDVAYVA